MKAKALNNKKEEKTASILKWIKKIETSKYNITDFFEKYKVPFSRSQYYIYSRRFKENGKSGLCDKRTKGGNRKVNAEIEAFISGCMAINPDVKTAWLKKEIFERYKCNLSPSGITKLIQRVCPEIRKRSRGRPEKHKVEVHEYYNSCGGFELIIALACHLKWPQETAKIIMNAINSIKSSEIYKESDKRRDKDGHDELGRFTSQYNKREDIRKSRFESVSYKRNKKNWKSMNIFNDRIATIERKCLAVLSLPVVTMNGSIRTVNCALGKELKHFAGCDYKQSSITKYLAELKYLGISTDLLEELIRFWKKTWGEDLEVQGADKLLCYYIDGNTKAVWSSKRVRKNKVTMLGRVMGCLEQVFIHDCFGRPVYFETYSGHSPYDGEYILELFDKIEEVIEEVPGSNTKVCRAIVMDGAGNSVKTLRNFASQDKYHYITTLDSYQWNERKINFINPPTRYKYGDATLREAEIELEDSQEKGYLVRSRTIKIDWDNGKELALLTSLPIELAGSSEVVQSYFKRWPSEELQFKSMNAAVSLKKVAGYGKKIVKDENIIKRQTHSANMINKLKNDLADQLEKISRHEKSIIELIPKERNLRSQSKIEDGKRIMPPDLAEKLKTYTKQINKHKEEIKKIKKADQDKFRRLRNHEREWLRLQGKEVVYKVDVELDQIVTYHRVGLANLYAYFIKYFMGEQSMSMMNLLQKILHLSAKIKETDDIRHICLDYNEKDKLVMEKLAGAIEKINKLNVVGPHGKKMVFGLQTLS